MKRIIALTGVAILTAACGMESSSQVSSHDESPLMTREDIKMQLVAKPDGDNSVWSAASLDNMLTLLGAGYDAERQLLLENYIGGSVANKAADGKLLDFEKEGLLVKSAYNIWAQEGVNLKSGYLNFLDTYFDGLRPGHLDVTNPVATADLINRWAAENTNDMIQKIVDPDRITPDLVALIGNALYFKGEWLEQFDPKLTKDLDFNVVSKNGDLSAKEVATMRKFSAELEYSRSGDVISLRLPYVGDTHAMYVSFAAKTSKSADFGPEITEVNTGADVTDIYRKAIVEGEAFAADYNNKANFDLFTLPKFTIESVLNSIQDDLIAGGYGALFTPGVLSNLSDDPRFYLSEVLQKAKIIVNEEGTEAAAVTIGGVRATSVRVTQHLLVNGPFAFAVRDDVNNVVLFEGVVRNPEVSE